MPAASSVRYELAREQADKRSLHGLLRCYLREVAVPLGLCKVAAAPGERGGCALPGGTPLLATIALPCVGLAVTAEVDRSSPVGIQHFGELRLICPQTQRRRKLSCLDFARLLLEELALRYARPFNAELLTQIEQSVDVTAVILRERPLPTIGLEPPARAYLASEQSLVYGHPYHPTPKARSGLDLAALRAYSPETGGAFAMHYFAVRRALVVEESLLQESATELLAAEVPGLEVPDGDWVVIPTHPWQAGHLNSLPLVQEAASADKIRYLGAHGEAFSATASVRTLYHEHSRFFYKLSLSFRITNCLRRNALSELSAALKVARIMRDLLPQLRQHFPSFRPLEEQAYATVQLDSACAEQQRAVSEGFGLMLRQSIEQLRAPDEACLLAASLFGNEQYGRQTLHELLASHGAAPATGPALCQWFKAYLEQLLPPLLYLYFECGLMFEPHLQNVVVGFQGGAPVALYLRDYENGRLIDGRGRAVVIPQLSASDRAELYYTEDKAWPRFVYCLFSNHVLEAVRQLSFGRYELETELWQQVHATCSEYLVKHPSAVANTLLGGLLAGAPLPGKCNLLTRLMSGRDAAAAFVALGNPWLKDTALPEAPTLENRAAQ